MYICLQYQPNTNTITRFTEFQWQDQWEERTMYLTPGIFFQLLYASWVFIWMIGSSTVISRSLHQKLFWNYSRFSQTRTKLRVEKQTLFTSNIWLDISPIPCVNETKALPSNSKSVTTFPTKLPCINQTRIESPQTIYQLIFWVGSSNTLKLIVGLALLILDASHYYRSKSWHINSSVRLSRDIKWICKDFWVFFEPLIIEQQNESHRFLFNWG